MEDHVPVVALVQACEHLGHRPCEPSADAPGLSSDVVVDVAACAAAGARPQPVRGPPSCGRCCRLWSPDARLLAVSHAPRALAVAGLNNVEAGPEGLDRQCSRRRGRGERRGGVRSLPLITISTRHAPDQPVTDPSGDGPPRRRSRAERTNAASPPGPPSLAQAEQAACCQAAPMATSAGEYSSGGACRAAARRVVIGGAGVEFPRFELKHD